MCKSPVLIFLQVNSRWFGSFLDAVNRLDAERNQYPPPRKALSKRTGPEADWERLIGQINLEPIDPDPRRTNPQKNQRVRLS